MTDVGPLIATCLQMDTQTSSGIDRKTSETLGSNCRPASWLTAAGASKAIRLTRSYPIRTWVSMTAVSSSVSLPGLSKMMSGMPILPISWR